MTATPDSAHAHHESLRRSRCLDDRRDAGRIAGKSSPRREMREKLPDVLAFLRRELEAGRQAYIVYPLIDESEKLEAKAASAEFEKWRERLPPFTCELLHGRVAAPEKQAIMERFRRGLTNVLVSTTVIEVGIDVPNATVMLIENAERFGLAQLHQLRGRIGRGGHKSYCILLHSDPSRRKRARNSRCWKRPATALRWRKPIGNCVGREICLAPRRADCRRSSLGSPLGREIDAAGAGRGARDLRADPTLAKPENQRFRQLVVEEVGKSFSHVS